MIKITVDRGTTKNVWNIIALFFALIQIMNLLLTIQIFLMLRLLLRLYVQTSKGTKGFVC